MKMMRIAGIRRAGNHLIIDWIGQSFGNYLHYNNLNYYYDKNALREVETRGNINHIPQEDELLIRSFEDIKYDKIPETLVSEKDTKIVILRDPFNNFASLIHSGRMQSKGRGKYMKWWKDHARKFLHDEGVMGINFNKFVSSKEYRLQIANELNIQSDESVLDEVAYHGSSFDGFEYAGKARQMKVLERWKKVWDNPLFHKCIDREILSLAGKIFNVKS